jgi:chromosome segregation ATPase
MACSTENALETIKNSGLLLVTKINELEETVENLTLSLKETKEANIAMKAEMQSLTRNLQAKTAIIDAMQRNLATCLKANTELAEQVLFGYLIRRFSLYIFILLST